MNLTKTFFISILVSILFLIGCEQELPPMDAENVIQLKEVGLREGVFVRRYNLTSAYGSNKTITPELLREYLTNILEPDYLFIQHAYDLGLKNKAISEKMNEYRTGLLANSHPFTSEPMNISKTELADFYKKSAYIYDVEVAQGNCYEMADTLQRFLQAGNKPPEANNEEQRADLSYPKYFQFNNLAFGATLHPELLPVLVTLNEGEVSKPVRTSPDFSVIKLVKKRKKKTIKPFEEMKQQLIMQGQSLFKYKRQKQLIEDLKKEYATSIKSELFDQLIGAFELVDNHGRINEKKFTKDQLDQAFITVNNEPLSLSAYIASFNRANQTLQMKEFTAKDLEAMTDDYIVQSLFSFDAVKRGVEENTYVKDRLVNKEHRYLLIEYLQKEIAGKVNISDDEARDHYENNRDKWPGDFEDVIKNIKNTMRNKRLYERKDEVVAKLRKKYPIRYNEPLLEKIAEYMTEAKSKQANPQ